MTAVELVGGWGYANLGDEAILAGYIEALKGEVDLRVRSVNPARTSRAQISRAAVTRDWRGRTAGIPVFGGGGYLNGRWTPFAQQKLARGASMTRRARGVVHAVELRRLSAGRLTARLASSFLEGSIVSVRDLESRDECYKTTRRHPDVVPDAIALLYPYLDKYRESRPESQGKILVNALDIGSRGDADEAEIDVDRWRPFLKELGTVLGDRMCLMVGGEGDRGFANSLGLQASVLEPRTVAELVGLIGSSSGLISVRMHPSLLGTALNIPTVAIPYCGKVRPTLDMIGVGHALTTNLSVDAVLSSLASTSDTTSVWAAAAATSRNWLLNAIDEASLPR